MPAVGNVNPGRPAGVPNTPRKRKTAPIAVGGHPSSVPAPTSAVPSGGGSAPTSAAVAGAPPTASGVSAAQTAAAKQQQLLQNYVLKQAQKALVPKELQLAPKTGMVTGLKPGVTPRSIGQDVREAAANIRKSDIRSVLTTRQREHVTEANAQGKVVPIHKALQPVPKQGRVTAGLPKGGVSLKAKVIAPGVPQSQTQKAVTGLPAGAQRKATKALKSTRPDLSTKNVIGTLAAASETFLPHVGQSSNPLQSGLGVNPIEGLKHPTQGRSAAQIAEDAAATAAIVAGPEASAALGRLGARFLESRGAGAGVEAATSEAGKVTSTAKKIISAPGRKVTKAAEAPIFQVSRKQGARLGLAPFAAAPAAAGTSPSGRISALVKGHEQAIFQHPVQTFGTTARTVESIPSALAAIPLDVAFSAKEGSLAPLHALAQQQLDYLKQVGNLYSGNPQTVEDTITQQVGLVPALSGLAGGYAIGKGAKALKEAKAGTRSTLPDVGFGVAPKIDRATRKTAEDYAAALAEDPMSQRSRDLRTKLEKQMTSEKPLAVHQRRSTEKVRGATREQAAQGQLTREMALPGRQLRHLGGHGNLLELTGRMAHEQVTKNVSVADVASYLGAHGIGPETRDVIGKLASNLESLKEPGKAIPPEHIADRAVLKALLKDPARTQEILNSPDLHAWLAGAHEIQHGRSIESHEITTNQPQRTPNPKFERATHLEQAQAHGVLFPEHRAQPELADMVHTRSGKNYKKGDPLVPERFGQNWDRQARSRGKAYERQARRWEDKAKLLEKKGHTKDAAKARASAADAKARADRILSVVNRHKRAEALDRKAAKVDAGKAEGNSTALRREAQQLREMGDRANALRHQAFMGQMHTLQAREGLRQPTYFRQMDVAQTGARDTADVPGSNAIRMERFRSGQLAAQGRINRSAEATVQNLVGQRVALEQQKSAMDFLRTVPLQVEDSIIHTNEHWAQLRREGKIPSGYKEVSVQTPKFRGVIQRNAELRKIYNEARYRGEVGRFKGGESAKLSIMVPESSIKAFDNQFENLSKGWRAVRTIQRVQVGALLATSPTWFEFQLAASPGQILARNWNPLNYYHAARSTAASARYTRQLKKGTEQWRNVPARVHTAFEANFGANSGNLLQVGETHTGLRPAQYHSLTDSFQFALKTPVGSFLRSVAEELRRGGPLINVNRRFEARVRTFAANLEMQRLHGLDVHGRPTLTSRAKNFIAGVAGAVDTIERHQKVLKGMTPHEREQFYNHNPTARAELEKPLYDTMGEWAGMTDFEKKIASVVIFYPFVRYSLRWLMTFPMNNPLKAAVLYNLAQANDVNLRKQLGGNPTFFQTWGNVVLHPGGTPKIGANLARAVPGGNSVLEALSTGKLNLSTFVRPFDPLIGTTLLALAGQTSSGYSSSVPTGDLLLRGLASLSPLTRPLQPKIGPEPSFTQKMFWAVSGTKPEGGIGKLVVPAVSTDIRRQAQTQKLSDLFNVAFGAPKFDDVKGAPIHQQKALYAQYQKGQTAWNQIHAMAVQYGVETVADQKRQLKQYKRRQTHAYKLLPQTTTKSSKPLLGSGLGGSSGALGGGLSSLGATNKNSAFVPSSHARTPNRLTALPGGKGTTVLAANRNAGSKQNKKSQQPQGGSKHKIVVPTGGNLSKNQQIFAGTMAKETGLDPSVIAAWMGGEGPAGDTTFAATGNQNWLALGYPGSQTSLSQNPVFNTPVSAAHATAEALKGKYGTPASIQSILSTAGQSKEAQINAIANSGWVSGTAGTNDYNGGNNLRATVDSFGSKAVKVNPKVLGVGKAPAKSVSRLKAITKAADKLNALHLPYSLGSGHVAGNVPNPKQLGALDCSSTVSYILQQAGYKVPTSVSGDMQSWGKPGPGAVTIYANPEHVFLKIGNRYFGTSHSNPGGGPGWIPTSYEQGEAMSGAYTVRHLTGLGKNVALQMGFGTSTAATPGVTLGSGGTTAVVDQSQAVTMNTPGFSTSPIKAGPPISLAGKSATKKLQTLQTLSQPGGVGKLLGLPTTSTASGGIPSLAKTQAALSADRLRLLGITTAA